MDGVVIAPWFVATGIASVATVAFATGLGAPRARPSGWRGLVIRWGHAVVWLLLAATFLSLAVGRDQLAGPPGLLALGSYVTFLWVLLGTRRE